MSIDIKISNIETGIPVFNKNLIPYMRDENNGYLTLTLPNTKYPYYKLINSTTKYILSLMDASRSVKDIYGMMCDKYGSKNSNKISSDLSTILLELWVNGIIKWKGHCNFMEKFQQIIDNGCKVRIAFDDDMSIIQRYLQTSYKKREQIKYVNPLIEIDTSLNTVIRASLFNMSYIFFILEKDNKVDGMILIKVPTVSTVATIDMIIYSNDDKELMELFWFNSVKMINDASIKPVSKVRAFLDQNSIKEESLFKSIGFQDITELKKEINDQDLKLVEYML